MQARLVSLSASTMRGVCDGKCSSVFEGVVDPCRSNAPRHSRPELLRVARLSPWCGGEGYAATERFGRAKEGVRRRFLVLKHGLPSPEAFAALVTARNPGGLPKVLGRLLETWASVVDGAGIALAGKPLRRAFAAAAARAGCPAR